MKILVISPTFPPMSSGGADFAFCLCQHLAEVGEDVCVVTSDIPSVVTSEEFKILPVMRSWGWGELIRLLKMARKFGPDVVEIHFSGGIYHHHPMITALPALLKRRLNGVRVILHIEYPEPVHSSRRLSPTRLIRKAIMFYCGRQNTDYGYGTLLRDSDRVIVLCDTHVNLLAKNYPDIARKCVMIPPPPSIKLCDNTRGQARRRGRSELNLAPTDTLLAYYGYIYPNKGVETLIKAVELAARHLPKIRLVMIGGTNEIVLKAANRPHYLQELKDYTQQLGIAEKMIWTNYFPSDSEQPSVLLGAADIGILPFDNGISMHRSTFGIAAVHDLPIISTRGENLEAPFIDGQNVLLCPPKDPQALAETIVRLISDPELQERLREGARTMTRKYFTWDKCIEQTLKAFEGSDGSVR
jgi:glycosyltransferase involved in cell wall biosynthesis